VHRGRLLRARCDKIECLQPKFVRCSFVFVGGFAHLARGDRRVELVARPCCCGIHGCHFVPSLTMGVRRSSRAFRKLPLRVWTTSHDRGVRPLRPESSRRADQVVGSPGKPAGSLDRTRRPDSWRGRAAAWFESSNPGWLPWTTPELADYVLLIAAILVWRQHFIPSTRSFHKVPRSSTDEVQERRLQVFRSN